LLLLYRDPVNPHIITQLSELMLRSLGYTRPGVAQALRGIAHRSAQEREFRGAAGGAYLLPAFVIIRRMSSCTTWRCATMPSNSFSFAHFLVGKREPTLASSQQYTVTPFLTSACSPMDLAFFTVASEGFAGAESDAVVCAAAGVEVWAGAAAAGAVAAEAAAGGGVLAGGALEVDCCEYAGSAAAMIEPIRSGKRTLK